MSTFGRSAEWSRRKPPVPKQRVKEPPEPELYEEDYWASPSIPMAPGDYERGILAEKSKALQREQEAKLIREAEAVRAKIRTRRPRTHNAPVPAQAHLEAMRACLERV